MRTRVESSSLNMETLDAVLSAEVSGVWGLMDSSSSLIAKLEVQCKTLSQQMPTAKQKIPQSANLRKRHAVISMTYIGLPFPVIRHV